MKNESNWLAKSLIFTGLIILGLAIYSNKFKFLTQSEVTKQILSLEKADHIEIQGYSPAVGVCLVSEIYHTKFTALKDGRPVSGVVCGGPHRGNTIHYN